MAIRFISLKSQPVSRVELHFEINYDVLQRERIGLRNAAHVVPASPSSEERQKDL